MFQHLIVPIDGSPASSRSVVVASRMAECVAGTVHTVSVVDSAASVVARIVESTPGGAVVMGCHGTDGVLRALFGPVVVVGPRCDLGVAGTLDGTYIVPLDGSDRADCVLPIVAAWTVEFGGSPWLVEVVDEALPRAPDVIESGYVGHRAAELRMRIDRGVEYDVLHGSHPARAIVDFATNERASLIFLTTRRRSGIGRLRTGAVAAEVVRRARSPVVLFRPPELRRAPTDDRRSVEPAVPPVWSREWCERYGPDAVTTPAGPRRALERSRR